MMFLDLVSELEKKHDIFDKHCYDNRQVYSLESIADLQQAQQPKSDVVYFTYDLSTLHNRKLPRNLIFCGESSFISEQLIPNTIQMPEKEMSIFLEDAEELLHSHYKLQDIYIQMLNAVMRGKGIGAMLENVGNALNTSIAIIDMSGKVISNSIPFQVDEPVWQESIKNGYCPPLFIEHIKDVKSQHGEEGGNGPFLRHCIDNHLFYLSNRIILQGELYGYIKTDEAGTLDFSGVPAFLVTNAFIVQRSAAKMFNIVSGPQLLSIHQGFCDYRPGFQCPWTHGP